MATTILLASSAPAGADTFAGNQVSAASNRTLIAPSIASQPTSVAVNPGQTATFSTTASGTPSLTYQWRRNGIDIAGAASSSYTTSPVTAADNGAQFSVIVTNAAGKIVSSIAALTVNPSVSPGQSQSPASAHEKPTLSERLLINSYVGVQIGSINYPFSNAQARPGFQAQSVQTPHAAARVILYGHEFNRYFSAQVSEMRPVLWVDYKNVHGDTFNHTVWMNIGGLTGKARLPLTRKFSIFGEGGLGIVTRKGFFIGSTPVVANASYSTFLFGGGGEYSLNDRWSLLASVIVAPGNASDNQPHTAFFSGGFNYTLRTIPSKVIKAEAVTGPLWPKNMLEAGYVSDVFGFRVNDFVANKIHIFWAGDVSVGNGASVNYEHNILHTQRWFALDWGADFASWNSKMNGQRYYTASLYPVLRFPLVRTNPVEFYFSYSFAGPSLITSTEIDDVVTGRHFTFQDYMSLGFFFGRKRHVTADVRIAHYSNGNLFPENPGITVPLGFYFGTTF